MSNDTTKARGDAEILFANERFYAAFAGGDVQAMADLWAKEGVVCCLHPGWEPLQQRREIMASWSAILQSPPPVTCVGPSVLPLGPEGAAVVCWEQVGENFLIATNLYRWEEGAWRIVHHQAGPVNGRPPETEIAAARSQTAN
ncbi:MAG: nuclear transport factor 2 family protein [Alphaproteobacteria bacterium]|nr:nuclear transport factor 2 family protein [Alphaproteobacteria bacterium]